MTRAHAVQGAAHCVCELDTCTCTFVISETWVEGVWSFVGGVHCPRGDRELCVLELLAARAAVGCSWSLWNCDGWAGLGCTVVTCVALRASS
eukprot:3035474-Prymnesium_polylepis.2